MWSENNVSLTPTYAPIEPAHCVELVALHRRAFSAKDIEASIFVSPRVANYLARVVGFSEQYPDHWLWGAWQEGRLTGYIYGRGLPDSWHLSYLGVSPEF